MDMSSMDMSSDSMSMYFTTQYKDVPVLFKTLKASGPSQAFGIFCVLFFASVAVRALAFLSMYLEQRVWHEVTEVTNVTIIEECGCEDEALDKDKALNSGSESSEPKKRAAVAQILSPGINNLYKDLIRLVLAFLTSMISFALMLAAMSWVLTYFFAICLGLAVGEVYFNRVKIALGMRNEGGAFCGSLH